MTDNKSISSEKPTLIRWLKMNWLLAILAIYGIWVWAPFLAPIFMRLGLVKVGSFVYWIYSFFCHQLPDRSYFLFGQRMSYSLPEIQSTWMDTVNPVLLRKFIGNQVMGWKVAWSDRMISFYGGIWIFAMLLYPFRRKIKKLPIWGLLLFLLPMIIDGGTHFISEFSGYQAGFRYSNIWLTVLTNNRFSRSFYAGNMLGTFNAWMRIITGLLAGLGLAWFILPLSNQNQASIIRDR